MIAEPTTAARAEYKRACRDLRHWQRILVGSLSERQRHIAHVRWGRAVRRRWMARDKMEDDGILDQNAE